MKRQTKFWYWLMPVILLSNAGCQTMLMSDLSTAVPLPEEKPVGSNAVVVDIRPAYGQRKTSEVAHTGQTVSEILTEQKTPFRNKLVHLERISPQTGRRHRMAISVNPSSRRVSMETDYALQPGDRVVISQDTTSSFERFMMSIIGRN